MQKLIVFNHVSLDGFFTDPKGDMGWAHKQDAEWNAFTESNATSGGILLFGRVTYDLMASFWPTPTALQHFPVVAERMNSLPKVVFSRTMSEATWRNTELVKGDIGAAVRKMKEATGPGMVIFGSGTIVSQLTQERLIDAYQIVVDPIVLGKGRTLFEGVKERMPLRLTESRIFGNGNALLTYEPA